MQTFKIEIQELLARVVEVKADNIDHAYSKVHDQYERAEIVLDYNDYVDVDFIDVDKQSKTEEMTMLIKDLIGYLYNDERIHFEKMRMPENHIFKKLERLKSIIDK